MRSETNAVGNVKFTDLNLTWYPAKIDSRTEADAGFNPNMKGFENNKDYNLAEHVNSLADAVMAVQRILGIEPHLDKNNVDRTTVDGRLTAIESIDYDPRYGGVGWDTSQTLVGHTHTGGPGHPAQVSLATDVKDLLNKNFLNLDNATVGSLTAADIAISSTVSTKISEAVADKLSTTQGGIIQKSLQVKGQLNSRLFREWDSDAAANGSVVTDYAVMTNKARQVTGNASVAILDSAVVNLHYGKYVMGVRAKTSSLVTEDVLSIYFYDLRDEGTGEHWVVQNSLTLKGTDFTAANKWQTFYLTFDHEGNTATSYSIVRVSKPTTTTANLSVFFDHAFVMPTHPAVYDM